jgi:hypothetical protein
MADELSPVKLLRGYADRLEALEKDVKAPETKAKSLAKKHRETVSKREEVSEGLHRIQEAIDGLYAERESLRVEFAEASFEADETKLAEIQSRKSEIDDTVLDHQEALEQLQEQLEKHKVDQTAIAEAIVQAEDMKLGNGFALAAEMRTVLVRYESDLRQRLAQARKLLPNVEPSVIEAVRMEDSDYAEAKARQEEEKARINEMARARALKESKPEVRHVRVIDNRTGRVVGYDLLDRNGNKVGYQSKEEVYQDT